MMWYCNIRSKFFAPRSGVLRLPKYIVVSIEAHYIKSQADFPPSGHTHRGRGTIHFSLYKSGTNVSYPSVPKANFRQTQSFNLLSNRGVCLLIHEKEAIRNIKNASGRAFTAASFTATNRHKNRTSENVRREDVYPAASNTFYCTYWYNIVFTTHNSLVLGYWDISFDSYAHARKPVNLLQVSAWC